MSEHADDESGLDNDGDDDDDEDEEEDDKAEEDDDDKDEEEEDGNIEGAGEIAEDKSGCLMSNVGSDFCVPLMEEAASFD